MKLKPEDTVVYIADIIYLLRKKIIDNLEWSRPQKNTGHGEPFVKTSAGRSELLTELYKDWKENDED